MRQSIPWRHVGAALAIASVAAMVAAAQANPPGTAAVSGVVTDAASGAPIAGVVVSIRRLGVAASVREQVTDAHGRFVFDELEASNRYVMNAMKPGYATAEYRRLPGQGPGTVFALAEGEWLSTVALALDRLGAVGGFVTDEFGEPVVGAFVRAIAEIGVGGRRVLAAGPTAKTDDRGEYRLAGLLAGRYHVMLPSVQHSVPAASTPAQVEGLRDDMYQRLESAIARNASTPRLNNGAIGSGDTRLIIGNFVAPPGPVDGRDRAYPQTFFAGAASMSASTPIDLADGEERSGVNIVIQPVPAVRVSGRLDGMTDPARLTVRLVSAGLEALASGSEAATTIVNPDGTFTFLSVPTGDYTILVRQSQFEFTMRPVFVPNTPQLPSTPGRELLGFQIVSWLPGGPAGAGYSASLSPPGTGYFARAPLTVGASDITTVALTLQRTLTIRGRFVYEDVPAPPSGRPLTVMAWPAERLAELGLAASRSEDPGVDPATFEIPAVVPGKYDLRVTPGPAAGFVVKSIVFEGQDYLTKPIDLGEGRDVSDVIVTFTGKRTAVTGTVRTSQGHPAADAAVIVFPADRTSWTTLGVVPVSFGLVATSADGTFSLSTLPAGEYLVAALTRPPKDPGDPALFASVAGEAVRVRLDWGVSRSVDLVVTAVK